jgi:kinesin family member 11
MRKYAKKSVPIEAKRVRVAIRCRPALKTEIDDCAGKFVSVVNTINDESGIGRVFLRNTIKGASRFREFAFDYAFGPDHDQGAVFEAVAEPIISDFLHGRNGTLFAYGQTGTGKVRPL